MKDCKWYKKRKYELFAAIINDEMQKDGVLVRAIVFGALGSVEKENTKAFKLLDIPEYKYIPLFKDINCIIVTELVKIWEYVKLIMSFMS